jgi:predicted RNA-binding Zn-ribbon protein involved in translation (DUF1610 family)
LEIDQVAREVADILGDSSTLDEISAEIASTSTQLDVSRVEDIIGQARRKVESAKSAATKNPAKVASETAAAIKLYNQAIAIAQEKELVELTEQIKTELPAAVQVLSPSSMVETAARPKPAPLPPQVTNLTCPQCNKSVQVGWVKCPFCKADLQALHSAAKLTCPQCGKSVQDGWVKCPFCMADLHKEVVTKPANPLADEFLKQVESRGLTIDKTRALAFVTDFQQKYKKQPTSKDIQEAVSKLVKSEAPAQLQLRIELARTQLTAGQIASAKSSSDNAQKIARGIKNLEPDLQASAEEIANEVQEKYDELRASFEEEMGSIQPFLVEFDFHGAEEALAELKARAAAAGIFEVVSACDQAIQVAREAQARNDAAQQEADAVLPLLESKQLGKAKAIADNNAQRVGTQQDIHPDIRQRVLEVRDQVHVELDAAREDLVAQMATTQELVGQLDFIGAEAMFAAIRGEAESAEFRDIVTSCDQNLTSMRAAKARNEEVQQLLAQVQSHFEKEPLQATKIAAENAVQKISTMQDIHPDLRQQVLDLRAEMADAQELVSQQSFNDAVTTLTGVRDKAAAADFSDIVAECDQRIPVITKVGKLYRLLSISNRIKIDDVTRVIEIDRAKLFDNLVEWSSMLSGFKIDGDYLVIESEDDLKAFIGKLDESFISWDKTEETKDGKS